MARLWGPEFSAGMTIFITRGIDDIPNACKQLNQTPWGRSPDFRNFKSSPDAGNNRLMDKQVEIYWHDRILLSCQKEQTTDKCNNLHNLKDIRLRERSRS